MEAGSQKGAGARSSGSVLVTARDRIVGARFVCAWICGLVLCTGLTPSLAVELHPSLQLAAISARQSAIVVSDEAGEQRVVYVGEKVSEDGWRLIGLGSDRIVLAPPVAVDGAHSVHVLVAVGERIPAIEKSRHELPIHYLARDLVVHPVAEHDSADSVRDQGRAGGDRP